MDKKGVRKTVDKKPFINPKMMDKKRKKYMEKRGDVAFTTPKRINNRSFFFIISFFLKDIIGCRSRPSK